jgi:hypothetical protein
VCLEAPVARVRKYRRKHVALDPLGKKDLHTSGKPLDVPREHDPHRSHDGATDRQRNPQWSQCLSRAKARH